MAAMEPLALSLILMFALAALTSLVAAAEHVAVESVRAGGPTSWAGANHPANRWTRAFLRHWYVLSQIAVQSDWRGKLGCLVGMLSALLSFAVLPIAPPFEATTPAVMIAADIDVALLFILAMWTISIFGEALVANDKRRLDRAAGHFGLMAALGLSAAGILRLCGSWRIDDMINVQSQLGVWWFARQPLGCAAMLLCLIWQMSRLTPARQGGPVRSSDENQTDVSGLEQLLLRLQLIAMTCLFVDLYCGGWHIWGIDLSASTAGMKWIGWLGQLFALHLKVVAVLMWLVWLRFVRLQDVSLSTWRMRIVIGALITALLNFIVTELSERYLATQPDVWKAGIAWGALLFVLIVIASCSQRAMPE